MLDCGSVNYRPVVLRVTKFFIGVLDRDDVLGLKRNEVPDVKPKEACRPVPQPTVRMTIRVLLEHLDPHPLSVTAVLTIRIRPVVEFKSHALPDKQCSPPVQVGDEVRA